MYDPARQDIPTMEGRQILRAARAERRKGEGRRKKKEREKKKRRSAVGSLATP
jgi:hypothetical protein